MLIPLAIILLIILIYCNKFKYNEFFTMTRVKSTIDYNEYAVVNSYKDKQEAADLIGKINLFTITFIKKLKEIYLETSDIADSDQLEFEKGREITLTLINRFNSKSFQENEPDSPDKTSYVTNKGDIISLCLREKVSGNNRFHNIEDLKFVTLHELSHIITPELSHTPLFWSNFKFVLIFCKKYKIYEAPNYDKDNVNYCGLTISYNPINDKTLT